MAICPQTHLPDLSINNIWANYRFLQWLASYLGWQNWKMRFATLSIILLPFIFASIATNSEDRFMLGEHTSIIEMAVLTPVQYQQLRDTFGIYILSSKSIQNLESEKTPENKKILEEIIKNLERDLKDKIFLGPSKFKKKVIDNLLGTEKIDQTSLSHFFSLIHKHAERKIILKMLPIQQNGNNTKQSNDQPTLKHIYINTHRDYLAEIVNPHLITQHNCADCPELLADLKTYITKKRMFLLELFNPHPFIQHNRDDCSEFLADLKTHLKKNNYTKKIEIIGMSYLGDSMVWPFYILVPCALLLLARSTQKVETFFKEIRCSINTSVTDYKQIYKDLIDKAKNGFACKGAWRLLTVIALTTSLSFIFFNSVTCTYPKLAHPYRHDKAYGFVDGGKQLIELANRIDIPKWDTNRQQAPLSWCASRIWVVFGYGLIPLIMAKFINIIGVIYSFCSAIGGKNLLIVKPLAHNKAGGFSILSDMAISFIYALVPYVIMIIASFFKEATPASPHNYLLILLFTPAYFITFFMPLISFRLAIKKTKTNYLSEISIQYNKINDALLEDIKKGDISTNNLDNREKHLEILKKMHDQIGSMSEWPLEIKTFYHFLGSFSVPPILVAIFQLLVKIYKG